MLCPQAGKGIIELATRGEETMSFTVAGGRQVVVRGSDLLPVDAQPGLFDLNGGPSASTGDPVVDAFVLAARSYVGPSRSSEALPLVDLIPVPGSNESVPAAWGAIAPLASQMFGADLARAGRLKLFVTDETDADLSMVTSLLDQHGCQLADYQRNREPGRATGATYNLEMCNGRPGLYLDLWQYQHLSGGDDPGGLMQTISDEVMTVWQHQIQPDIRSGTTVPYWLYEGSQTLPFMLYSADRLARPILEDIAPQCRSAGLDGVAWEGYEAGAQQSCPHQLGSAALMLLVARVGVEPVLGYFRAGSAIDHEERFVAMAGESSMRFAERVMSWVDMRAERGSSATPLAADGAEYRRLAQQWLGR